MKHTTKRWKPEMTYLNEIQWAQAKIFVWVMCTEDAEQDTEELTKTVHRSLIIVSHLTNESIKISKLKFMNDGMSGKMPFIR